MLALILEIIFVGGLILYALYFIIRNHINKDNDERILGKMINDIKQTEEIKKNCSKQDIDKIKKEMNEYTRDK
jgi:hypothetical protein